ncbi:hypothetical protein BSL78_03251 [Apostichopus japonicus]|uniref:Tectonic-1-3 domain-containing protein n=1 Tax=Stichopus japonicus TaxID=307972 RepID=A0A2G8LHS1_STIJA|nr:hypothetical protein BSL78_03251 [Apostichopus japonicus]
MMTTSSMGNDSDTDDPAVQREVRSVTQRFRTTFTYRPSVVSDRVTRLYEADPVQSSRSGNPGYNTGTAVLSGVAVYEMVETTTSPPVNCTADPQDLSCNETRQDNTVFTTVDVSYGNRIQMIMPGSNGLCSEATSQEIHFGENTLSGCFLRLSLSDLSNCTELRTYMKENLKTFVAADVIGKTGVADVLQESNWAAIIAEENENVDDSGPIQPTGTSVTTESPMTTEYPNQTFVQDPTPPQILDQLHGICFDVPTGVNLEVLITDAGEYNGFVIQEIVSAKISYTSAVLKMNCMGANAVRCQSTNTTTGVDEEYVQSFMVTSSVTFTKVPPIPPESVILYYKDYNPALCKQDSCLRGIFYPFTESFQGDSYEYSLAVTMITILIATGYVIVTTPWLGLKMW